jgi:Flp pilus assembly pilin Flp
MEVYLMCVNLLTRLFKDESGQGITEYGAILAFVAILIALVFTLVNGGIKDAISAAFSTVVSSLNALSAAAAS